MPIRFRLALVFTAAAAVLFALGSWLLISVLSSSLLSAIDAQLATRLSGGRPVPGPVGRVARPAPAARRRPVSTSSRSSTPPGGSAGPARTPTRRRYCPRPAAARRPATG